jgi:hypothetical protein
VLCNLKAQQMEQIETKITTCHGVISNRRRKEEEMVKMKIKVGDEGNKQILQGVGQHGYI